MPSFDIVSEIDHHELSNAVDQVNREIGNRYDFKGSDASISAQEQVLTLQAESDFQVKQMVPLLYERMSKRGIDVQAAEQGDMQSTGRRAQLQITIREGIEKELAKKIVKFVKDSKLKVQASVAGDQVRVTGKKRDDLQQVIQTLKGHDFGLPLQFKNFRD